MKLIYRRARVLFVAVSSATLAACSSDAVAVPGAPAPIGTVSPDDAGVSGEGGTMEGGKEASAAPTFTAVYDGIISKRCTFCHGTSHSTGLAMATRDLAYTNLVGMGGVLANGDACKNGTRKRIVPGDAAASLLSNKVNASQDCGSPMPLGGAKLGQDDIDLIARWINAGAMSN